MNPSTKTSFIQFLQRVKRSQTDRKLGGVCGGLAAHSEIPAWVFRVLFIALLPTGVGALAYIALWICMPTEPVPPVAAHVPAEESSPAT